MYKGILFSHKKEESAANCDNMDEAWEPYAKQNTSEKERQILYDITYMWNLKKLKA